MKKLDEVMDNLILRIDTKQLAQQNINEILKNPKLCKSILLMSHCDPEKFAETLSNISLGIYLGRESMKVDKVTEDETNKSMPEVS